MINVSANNTDYSLPPIYSVFSHNTIILVTLIISLVAVFTVASNVVVLIALVRSRREDNRNVITGSHDNGITKLTMASMAVVDVLIGTLLAPLLSMDIINKGKWFLGRDMCIAKQALNYLINSVLIYNILFMALDKYLAICKPIFYRLLTVRHGYAMVVLAWSIPCVTLTVNYGSGLSQMGEEATVMTFDQMQLCAKALNKPVLLIMSSLNFFLPYFLSATLYFLVLREIRSFNKRTPRNKSMKDFKKMSDLGTEVTTATSFPNSFVIANDNISGDTSFSFTMTGDAQLPVSDGKMPDNEYEETCHHRNIKVTQLVAYDNTSTTRSRNSKKTLRSRQTRRNLRAYKTIGCIFFGFTLCWVPSWIFFIILVYKGYMAQIMWALIIFLFLMYMNAAINPFIYCSIRSVRSQVKTLLCLTL